MYQYAGRILEVVDGDTVKLEVDLGFHVRVHETFRLVGINSPELHSKDAQEKTRAAAARDFLKSMVNGPLVVATQKDELDKYGRWLARIFRRGETVSINDEMVKAGHAVPYDGGKR